MYIYIYIIHTHTLFGGINRIKIIPWGALSMLGPTLSSDYTAKRPNAWGLGFMKKGNDPARAQMQRERSSSLRQDPFFVQVRVPIIILFHDVC